MGDWKKVYDKTVTLMKVNHDILIRKKKTKISVKNILQFMVRQFWTSVWSKKNK